MSFPYKPSFWADDLAPARTEALTSDVEADVVIVGGGFSGLSSAHYLKPAKPDLDVVVLEAEHVGFASNGRNFGVVCPGGRELSSPDDFDPGEAESMLRDAVARHEHIWGNDHPEVARSLVALAELLRKRDRAAKENGVTGDESDDRLLELMSEHPTLLQRPIGEPDLAVEGGAPKPQV